MSKTATVILGFLGVLVLVGLFVAATAAPVAGTASVNYYEAGVRWTKSGFYVGTTQQFAVDSNGNATTTGTLSVGSSGSTISGIIATTCTGIVYASLGATTTAPIDCAVTGALTTAKYVALELAPGQPAAGILRNLIVWGGHASSTPGYITANITNLTGAATSSYAQATTSMRVLVIQ